MAPAASGQCSKGVYLLDIALRVLERRGKPKTESEGANGKSNLILKLKAAVDLGS